MRKYEGETLLDPQIEGIDRETLIDRMDRTAQNFGRTLKEQEQGTLEGYESIDALFVVHPSIALEIARSEATYGHFELDDESAVHMLMDIFMERNEIKED